MQRIKKCAACRYCRVHTALKTTIVLLAGAIVAIAVLLNNGM